MIKHKFKNGLTVYYIKREGNISSFCIGFNAGASVEEKYELGLAHVVEHMVFKGTTNRSESEINSLCDEVFGFNNAMTNYPYVIYYGTTLSSEFKKGFEVYSDIILNPTFLKEGFKEEIGVVLEELKEWKDDPYQECEDELFFNSFNNRRIKKLIIGNKESVKDITQEDVKNFYFKHYAPQNCVISVVSSLEFSEVLDIVNENFQHWEKKYCPSEKSLYEKNNEGIFLKMRKDLQGAKIQYCFTIDFLSKEEIKILKIFNSKFGEGTSSILYDEIRTKKGLAYDISSSIKNENGIKLFTIRVGTSEDKVDEVINIINQKIKDIKSIKKIFTEDNINKILKSLNLKRELALERSIELCKKITTYKIMFDSTKDVFEYSWDKTHINEEIILNIANKVLKNPSIQVLKP